MCRLSAVVSFTLVALALVATDAVAASPTIHTHTSFGLLFVLAADSHDNLYVADQRHSLESKPHDLFRTPSQAGLF